MLNYFCCLPVSRITQKLVDDFFSYTGQVGRAREDLNQFLDRTGSDSDKGILKRILKHCKNPEICSFSINNIDKSRKKYKKYKKHKMELAQPWRRCTLSESLVVVFLPFNCYRRLQLR